MADGDPGFVSGGALHSVVHHHASGASETVLSIPLGSNKFHVYLACRTSINADGTSYGSYWTFVKAHSDDTLPVTHQFAGDVLGTTGFSFAISGGNLVVSSQAPAGAYSKVSVWGFSFDDTTGVVSNRPAGSFAFGTHVQAAETDEDLVSVALQDRDQRAMFMLWGAIKASTNAFQAGVELVAAHPDAGTARAQVGGFGGGLSVDLTLDNNPGALDLTVFAEVGVVTGVAMFGHGFEINRAL